MHISHACLLLGSSSLVLVRYASFIFCRSFFSVTQAAMKADPAIGLTDQQADAVITSTAIAFGIAKFPAGILVNSVSPKQALLAFMAATSAVVFVYGSSWCDSYDKMFVVALLNAIPQAGAYPAATKLVCAGFAPDQHPRVFALISIGSRVGQVPAPPSFKLVLLGASTTGRPSTCVHVCVHVGVGTHGPAHT